MEFLRSKVEEHLTCSVCLEQLKDPKVLPCLHSFCHECIVRLAQKNKSNNINCPDCRKVAQVDNPDNPSNLPTNFFINNLLATMALMDEKSEEVKCENCPEENPAAARCEECAMFFCPYCSEFHRKSRPTKHHVLRTLQELKSARAGPSCVAEKMRCKKHKEELIKLYCKTCQSTICRDCTIVEHKTHDYCFIEDVAAGQKVILKQNMKEVQERQDTLQRAIASLRLFDESLIDENALLVAQVTSHFDQLQKIVVVKKNELLSKINSLTNLKRKQLLAQIEALEVALASCKSSIEFTEKAFKNGNDVQVLSMQKYILQSLEDLKKVKDVTKPCVTRNLVFSSPLSIEDTDKNFLSLCAVGEIIADPVQCLAEFADQRRHLKRNRQTTVRIICFDRNKQRIKRGGQEVNATISGVDYDDAAIKDNLDGTHTVTFTPRCGGAVEVKATINGYPAPNCSLTRDVEWIFSENYSNAQLSDDCLSIIFRPNLSGGWYPQSCGVGECFFEGGVHSWKVLYKVTTETRKYLLKNEPHPGGTKIRNRYFNRKAVYTCEVGVTSTPDYIEGSCFTLAFECSYDEETLFSLTLNIPGKWLHVVKEYGDEKMTDNVIEINGKQFWPFVALSDNFQATFVYD